MAGPYGHWPREDIEHARNESIGELHFLTNEICGTLKQPRPPEWHDFTLDLSSTFLIDGDCANADFTDTELSSARFERVKLDGAKLKPTAFAASDWVETLWWNAGQINQHLLIYLKDNYYLGHNKDEFTKNYDGPVPVGVDFKKRLEHCRSVGITCN
jgi:Pentapeptide repeats (8 copies)